MSLVSARSYTWTPLGGTSPVLNSLGLDIAAGERVLIAGASGAGKSTLLRAIAGVLDEVTPGESSGALLVAGSPPMAGVSGVVLVGQHPGEGIVAGTVGREVAFGPENLGLPPEEIWARVDQALAAVGLPYPPSHPTLALSGGQAQRLALAGALAIRPLVLALDEPVSMLDARSANELRSAITKSLNESAEIIPNLNPSDTGSTRRTLLVADHDIEAWIGLVERIIVLGCDGTIVADGPIDRVLTTRRQELLDLGLWVPGAEPPAPVQVDCGLVQPLLEIPNRLLTGVGLGLTRPRTPGLRVSPKREQLLVLDQIDCQVNSGELLAIRGSSGVGKSTLIAALCGLLALDEGELTWGGGEPKSDPAGWDSKVLASRFGWVPQFSEDTTVHNSVEASLLATARALGQDEDDSRERAVGLLKVLGLETRLKDHPLRLSGGEQRRLAVATAVLHGPGLVALDEPTVGLDRHTWAAVTGVMTAARASGTGIIVATHDEHLAALADRVQTLIPPGRDGQRTRITVESQAQYSHQTNNKAAEQLSPDLPTAPPAGLTALSPGVVTSLHDVATTADTSTPPKESTRRNTLSSPNRLNRVGAGQPVGLLARCGPVALSAVVLIFTIAGLFSSGIVPLGTGMVALLIVGAVVTGPGFPLVRLVPGLIGIASVMWSNWLLSSGNSITAAVQAGLRVGFIAFPAIVAVSFIDPVRFGDQFAQLLKMPSRPVLALVAALQRLDDLHQRWNQLVACRRIRGLTPGRSPASRLRHGASLLLALLVDSVRQAGRLAIAMDTRGYSGETAKRCRSWAQPAPWVRADTTLILLASALAWTPLLVSAMG